MIAKILNDAFILLLSGCAKLNEHGEVEWGNEYGLYYITFPTQSPNYAVVRKYWENGNKHIETEYRDGTLSGRFAVYHRNGELDYEKEYFNYDPIEG